MFICDTPPELCFFLSSKAQDAFCNITNKNQQHKSCGDNISPVFHKLSTQLEYMLTLKDITSHYWDILLSYKTALW